MPDGTYAPQSPDLSSFLSSASPQKKPPTSSYTPRSPNLLSFSSSAPVHAGHPREHSGLGIAYQPSPAQQFHSYDDSQPNLSFASAQYAAQYGQYGQNPANLPAIPDLPPSHPFPHQQPQAVFPAQPFAPHQGQFRSDLTADAQLGYYEPRSITGQPDMSVRGKRGAVKIENGAGSSGDLGPSQGIEIKTKFPVARIKRIMQADEEVGKVAQVTPVAVSKALELFMIELVTKSATLAKSSNSKRVTAQHLKKVIEGDDQYDFLAEIVGRVAEGPDAGGKRVKSEEGSDDEDMDKTGRSAKKAKGRRKKGE